MTATLTADDLEARGYFFRRDHSTDERHYGAEQWSWGIGRTVVADGYASLADAVRDAAEDAAQQGGAA